MAEYEVRPVAGGRTVRIEADTDELALEIASEFVEASDEAYVYPADLPVGWEGDDGED